MVPRRSSQAAPLNLEPPQGLTASAVEHTHKPQQSTQPSRHKLRYLNLTCNRSSRVRRSARQRGACLSTKNLGRHAGLGQVRDRTPTHLLIGTPYSFGACTPLLPSPDCQLMDSSQWGRWPEHNSGSHRVHAQAGAMTSTFQINALFGNSGTKQLKKGQQKAGSQAKKVGSQVKKAASGPKKFPVAPGGGKRSGPGGRYQNGEASVELQQLQHVVPGARMTCGVLCRRALAAKHREARLAGRHAAGRQGLRPSGPGQAERLPAGATNALAA